MGGSTADRLLIEMAEQCEREAKMLDAEDSQLLQ
jgi:hypothetical protein